jgi:hypothetical protein
MVTDRTSLPTELEAICREIAQLEFKKEGLEKAYYFGSYVPRVQHGQQTTERQESKNR